MDEAAYNHLLAQDAGFTPGLCLHSDDFTFSAAAVDGTRRRILPFGGLILRFHEALFSTPDEVHEFVVAHFTAKLRELSHKCALHVRAYPISGWVAMELLSRKALIVDLSVRSQLQAIVNNFPSPLRYNTKPHILNRRWHFFTLIANHRTVVATHLMQHVPSRGPDAAHNQFPWGGLQKRLGRGAEE